MALPSIETCGSAEVSCDQLFAIGERLLTVAVNGVNNEGGYIDDCSHPNVDGMVVLGSPDGYPQTDIVIVSMLRAGPKVTPSNAGRAVSPFTFESTWNIRLLESGWVTFEDAGDEQVGIPDPSKLSVLSLHSYAHAEQMYRALANAIATGSLLNCSPGNCGASLRDLVPVEPRGHLAGWDVIVTVPLDFNKPCTS